MNTRILTQIESNYTGKVPEIRPGDTVRVHQKIKEGNKERIQIFEGVVLRIRGGGIRQSFLVRKVSFGVGVEKNFPLYSPNIAKIEIKKRAKVRRAYLSYLRNLTGKSARLKDKQFDSLAVNVQEEPEVVEKVSPISAEESATIEEAKAEHEDEAGNKSSEEGGQATEKAEIAEGIKEAEKDAQAREGKKPKKSAEDQPTKEINKEIVEEI